MNYVFPEVVLQSWAEPEPRRRFQPPAWAMLVLCPVLSLLAVVWHGPASLPVLAVVDILLLLLSRPKPKFFVRMGIACLWQIVIITGLYCLRFSLSEWATGLEISFRLILVFLPGMLTVRLVPASALERILRRVLPGNMAFVASCCLRFFPVLLERIRITHEAQVLRGARVLPRELISPRNWPDAIVCIGFPAIVQSIELATEIADSARVRGFEMRSPRTLWPLDEEQRQTAASDTVKESH